MWRGDYMMFTESKGEWNISPLGCTLLFEWPLENSFWKKTTHLSTSLCNHTLDCWKNSEGKYVESQFVVIFRQNHWASTPRAIGTEMSQRLALGLCRLQTDSNEFTQCFTIYIEGKSNSVISMVHSIMNLPFLLCPHCPFLQISLLKLSPIVFFHFSKMKYSKIQ